MVTTMKYVVYYRVSTKRQGDSGLGLEAQRVYINHYLRPDEIAHEFIEVQSAKTIDGRDQLQQAIRLCVSEGYTLAVAKIDRLSRTTEDALAIYKELDGRLYSCDIPTEKGAKMDKFTLTIFMAIADRERELIGIRTKQALDVKREREGEWRIGQLQKMERANGASTNRTNAIHDYRRIAGYVSLLRNNGETLQGIANILNNEGHTTRQGRLFTRMTIHRLLQRNA